MGRIKSIYNTTKDVVRGRNAGIIASWAIIITSILAIIALNFGLYLWYFQANPPVEFEYSVFISEEAEVGGPVETASSFCRYTDSRVEVSRRWINVDTNHIFIWDLEPLELQGNEGCDERGSVLTVPDNLELTEGHYVIEVSLNYPEVNVLSPPRKVVYLIGEDAPVYITVPEEK